MVTTVESFIIFGSSPLTAVNYNQMQTAWENTVTYHAVLVAFAVALLIPVIKIGNKTTACNPLCAVISL